MITLSKSGNTVTFTFDENSGYIQNGTIDVPVNSLALITDESDMATFRKSASNDIFISARYEEFGMTKSELESWYKANMVSSGGGGGTGGTTPEEVQQMIDQSISGKTDTSAFTSYTTSTNSRLAEDEEVTARALVDLNANKANLSDIPSVSGYADSVKYNSTSKYVEFYHNGTGGTKVYEFDASPFIIDGMVDNVVISGSDSTESVDLSAASIDPGYTFSGGPTTKFIVNVKDAWWQDDEEQSFVTFEYNQGADLFWCHRGVIEQEGIATITNSGNVITVVSNNAYGSVYIDTSALYDSIIAVYEKVLVITFNTDAGKQDIVIPLSEIFNSNDYYTKSEVNTALSGKQDTLISGTNIKTINNQSILGSGNIDIQGGGGTGTCTVDETTIYDIYSGAYSNDALDMRVNYVVLDYTGDKTLGNASVDVNFRDANNNTYVNQYINFDYSTSSYTLNDQSQAEYIDITYDPTIEDFKIAVASAYTSTVFVGRISNFWGNYIKVPFYTISSGSPCTVIENDVTSAISSVRDGVFKALRTVNVTSQKTQLNIYSETIGGASNSFSVKFDEIDGSNNRLKPDIYVGLGTSGWTEINVTEQCNANNLKGTKFRVTYDYSEFNAYNMNLSLYASWAGNMQNDYVTFDEQTQQPSLQSSTFTGATVDWNASTKELVITYPTTIDWYGEQVSVNIDQIYSNNCQFGQAIIKLESYGEDKQALKPYVQETRAALGGLSLVKLTQAEYDALAPDYDANTLYIIKD